MEQGIPSGIYREHILELYKNPQNFGLLGKPSHEHKEFNSICGDEINVQLAVNSNKISDVKFQGSGCVISLVSASLLTEKIKGMPVSDVKKLEQKDMIKLLGIKKLSPARIKCATLALSAVKGALKND